MKNEKIKVRNPVAKHAHKFNSSRAHEDKLKELARKACRGQKPSGLFWLI